MINDENSILETNRLLKHHINRIINTAIHTNGCTAKEAIISMEAAISKIKKDYKNSLSLKSAREWYKQK